MITFHCGSCGAEREALDEIVAHLTKDNWHCWHKESGGFFQMKIERHDCDRDWCRARQRLILGQEPGADFT